VKKKQEKTEHLPWFGLGYVLPTMRVYKKLIIGMIATGLICSVLDSMIPLFQRYAVNHFITGNTLAGIGIFALVYFGAILVLEAFEDYSVYATSKLEVSMGYTLRKNAFDHLQELSLSYYNQNGVGYIHARLMSDVDRIGSLCSWTVMQLVWDGSYLIYVLIIMMVVCWKLGLILLILTPIEILICLYFQKNLTTANRKVREINSRITANYNEGITGAKTIKTMVAGRRVEENFFGETDRMHGAAVKVGHYRGLLRGMVDLTASVGLALVLWRGGVLNLSGGLDIATFSAFTSYAVYMTQSITNLAEDLQALVNAQVNIERLHKLISAQPDVVDSPEVIEKYGTALEPKKENWEPLYGDVEFRDVTFRYPDGEETVLSHFNLTVPQGTRVAIVGETGAGKSTLVNLVCRFFEATEGQVLIDGRDVKERSQLWLHSSIGYVLQTPYLFSGTILENLRYGKPEATMEEVEEACRRVCADQVIARLEEGYNSQVGESGDLLSTGEKQLISFARAILSDPRILILDEATSSVDTLTEQIIQSAISEVTRGRTSFIIAHRLSTIRDADVILMVKGGKIIEQGTHHGLMEAKGAYYQLYTRQFAKGSMEQVLQGQGDAG
jgi:ATP-binding cassette subfamily B protein